MHRQLVAFVAVVFAGTPAFADPEFAIGSRPAWFALAGPSAGASVGPNNRGMFAGGEVSVVRVRDRGFAGLYADGHYDFAAGATMFTVGPELGVVRRSPTLPIALGVDGGAAVRLSDGDESVGAAGRVYLTIAGTTSLYARYLHFGDGEGVGQIGLALKFPIAAPFGRPSSAVMP